MSQTKDIKERFIRFEENPCKYCGLNIRKVIVDNHTFHIDENGFHITDKKSKICYSRGYHSYKDGSLFWEYLGE